MQHFSMTNRSSLQAGIWPLRTRAPEDLSADQQQKVFAVQQCNARGALKMTASPEGERCVTSPFCL